MALSLKDFTFPRMAISLPLAILAVVLLIFINELSFHRSSEALVNMDQAQHSQVAVDMLMQHVLDAETGQRGYLLTGDEKYLQPYHHALAQVNTTLETLRQLSASYPGETADFNIMARQISSKLAELDLSLRMRKEGREDAWKFVLTTDVGRDQMDQIRLHAGNLVKASKARIDRADQALARILMLSRFGVAIIALTGLLAFYLYLSKSRALFASGLREQNSLQRERDLLEGEVQERTASLTELATHLQNVREDERGHLARELHDELGALLTAAKLDVARLKSRLGPILPDANERMDHLIVTLNSGIALKRRIVEDLRPSSLSHLGLVASLEILAREFEEQSGLSISTELETVEIGGAAQLTVYRLVQESLTNIAKYAEAQQVEVVLQNLEGYISIDVKDNGKGFSPGDVNSGSHGLTGMRHRVEAAGGRLTVTSEPGSGTKIAAVLPTDR
jgi:signal transduction histidine kinase